MVLDSLFQLANQTVSVTEVTYETMLELIPTSVWFSLLIISLIIVIFGIIGYSIKENIWTVLLFQFLGIFISFVMYPVILILLGG